MRAQSLTTILAFLLATLVPASAVEAFPLTYHVALSGNYADAGGGGPAAGAGSFTIDGLDPDPTKNVPQYLSTLAPPGALAFDLLAFDLTIEGHSYDVGDITSFLIIADTAGLIYTFGLHLDDPSSDAGGVIQFISDAAFNSGVGYDPSFWTVQGPQGYPTQYYTGSLQPSVQLSRISVPEPGTVLLFCVALAALGWSRRNALADRFIPAIGSPRGVLIHTSPMPA